MVDKQEIMWASFAPSLSPREANRCFFSQMFNNEKYEERILCHHSYAEYCDRYFELGSSAIFSYARDFLPFHREQRNMIISFVNHSLMFFYRGWVNSGKKMSLDELLDLSETLLSGVQAYIAK